LRVSGLRDAASSRYRHHASSQAQAWHTGHRGRARPRAHGAPNARCRPRRSPWPGARWDISGQRPHRDRPQHRHGATIAARWASSCGGRHRGDRAHPPGAQGAPES